MISQYMITQIAMNALFLYFFLKYQAIWRTFSTINFFLKTTVSLSKRVRYKTPCDIQSSTQIDNEEIKKSAIHWINCFRKQAQRRAAEDRSRHFPT